VTTKRSLSSWKLALTVSTQCVASVRINGAVDGKLVLISTLNRRPE
jgi:hypothetical protein